MNSSVFWQVAYHLCGVTLLGKTKEEPLGTLPYPVRTAVLRAAKGLDGKAIEIQLEEKVLEYLGGKYAWVDSWTLKDEYLARRLNSHKPSSYTNFPSIERYFEYYRLREKRASGLDEHYAERMFVERVFVPVFGLAALRFLKPQQGFTDSTGKQRRVDFVLEGEKQYAIEIEGAAYHARERIGHERFEDEKQRQAELSIHGYTYLPFTFESLSNDYAKALLGDLILEDKVLWRMVQAKQSSDEHRDTGTASYEELEALLKRFPERFPVYQKFFLALIHDAIEEGKAALHIADISPNLPLMAIALLDTVACLERVMELYSHSLKLPEITLHLVGETPEAHKEVLRYYLNRPFAEGDGRTDISHHQVAIMQTSHLPQGVQLDYCSKAETASLDTPIQAKSFTAIERAGAPFLTKLGNKLPLQATPVSFERPVLDYFARRYFPYAELQHEQLILLQRALQQESGLGILPTGFGKSAIFQLFALLMPRATLVISPLKALMRDQLHAMSKRGWMAVGAISSNDSAAEKAAKLKRFAEHKTRLLYISPERLQIKGFRDELRATIENTPVGALVVDEAHCVSEWGHDVRPAYLQIGPVREALEQASGRTVPIIALTATASPIVRRDIVAMLNLPQGSVVQLSSSDRPNLSLSVHPVQPGITAKGETLQRLLKNDIPRALKIPFDELIPVGAEPPFQHTGVIFSIYANPHGRTTLAEGVHGIADYLTENVARDKSLVQVHASGEPGLCPKCGSTLYISANKQIIGDVTGDKNNAPNAKFYCTKCEHLFLKPKNASGWESEILQRQDDFQNNLFPVLVATKGYGMGIDKRNIRFIVHHALSGGFEGYYQEAGRAGRDKKQAHVALVYSKPTAECYETHLRKFEAPPCASNKGNLQFHRCPYGLEGLCDYGRQAHFIAHSYAGADEDLSAILGVFGQLSETNIIPASGDSELSSKQLALYRLQQLGFIDGYSLRYKSLWNVDIEVEKAEVSRETVKDKLRGYLIRSGLANTEAEKELSSLERIQAVKDKPPHYGLLEKAATVFLRRVYDVVPRMRYEMLTNQLDYATSNERKECRRHRIRSVFDSEGVALEGYSCGFCDVCEPTLRFKREQAEVPTHDAQVDDIVRNLGATLQVFNTEELPLIVKIATEKKASRGLFYRVTNTLEHDGTNVSALYLAGALGRQHPEFKERSLNYLKFGFQELKRQGKGDSELSLTYQEGKHLDNKEAFSWIDEKKGPFDTARGLVFLEREAQQVYGENSDERRNLSSLRKVRELKVLSKDIKKVAPEIAALQEALSSLPTLER